MTSSLQHDLRVSRFGMKNNPTCATVKVVPTEEKIQGVGSEQPPDHNAKPLSPLIAAVAVNHGEGSAMLKSNPLRLASLPFEQLHPQSQSPQQPLPHALDDIGVKPVAMNNRRTCPVVTAEMKSQGAGFEHLSDPSARPLSALIAAMAVNHTLAQGTTLPLPGCWVREVFREALQLEGSSAQAPSGVPLQVHLSWV